MSKKKNRKSKIEPKLDARRRIVEEKEDEGARTQTCPMCGTFYEDRKPEEPYACVRCGGEGLDCCVPGNNTLCTECQNAEDEGVYE